MTIADMFNPPITPGQRAARHLSKRADELAEGARTAEAIGWTHIAAEYQVLAAIALKAARAEAKS